MGKKNCFLEQGGHYRTSYKPCSDSKAISTPSLYISLLALTDISGECSKDLSCCIRSYVAHKKSKKKKKNR
jgi:hypothetical protein